MWGRSERDSTYADINRLLYADEASTTVVANATWQIEDLSAIDLAKSYSQTELTRLIDKLIATQQRCHGSHIEKLQAAIAILRGEKDAPQQLITQILKEEQLPYVDQQVTTILNELRQAFHSNNSEKNLEELYQMFRLKIRSIYNNLELLRLYEDIKDQTGENNAKMIFANWDLVGDEIKKNHRSFTQKDRKKIFDTAMARFQQQSVEKGMQRVKRELRTGELTADPKVVKDQLGKTWDMLSPEQKSEVDVLIKKELVIKQLKRRILYQVPPLEESVYNMLQKNTRTLKDMKVIDQNIAVFLHRLLTEENIKGLTFDLLQERIRMCKMEIRYLSVGGDHQSAALVRALTDTLTDRLEDLGHSWSRQLKIQIVEMYENHQELKQFPLLKKLLSRESDQLLKSEPRKFMIEHMREHKRELRKFIDPSKYNEASCTDAVEKFLSSSMTTEVNEMGYGKLRERFMETAKSAQIFYTKYKTNISTEFIQGLQDQQEDLNEGVCLAFSARISCSLEDNPSLSLTQLSNELPIKPKDRFHQASYKTQFFIDRPSAVHSYFPENIANKEHGYGMFDSKACFNSIEEFSRNFDSISGTLQGSSGVCMLNFICKGGFAHSTVLIIDPINSRYGIIDCNIGIIDFSSLQENHEYAASAVLQCAKDLLEFYGDMQSIDIRQHQLNNHITPGI